MMALPPPGTLLCWTKQEVEQFYRSYRPFRIDREPWPHEVVYLGGRVTYVPPDRFLIDGPAGPSDSVWIVPGTLDPETKIRHPELWSPRW